MAFIKIITDHIAKNYDLSKDLLTIIFPNKRAALMLRKEFESIKQNIWLPQILSIQEAMSMWSGIQLSENIDVIFELIKILNKNNFSSDSNVFGLASQMAKDFDEIDQYKVPADNLFSYLKEAKIIEKWNLGDSENSIERDYISFFASLKDYYKDLRTELGKYDSGYYGMITRTLSELDESELIKAVGNNKIIFAGFNAMTTTEEDIIVKLVHNNKAEIFWDLDRYYFDDEQQEAGFFAREFFKKHKNIEQNFINDNINNKKINIIGVSGTTIQTNALLHRLNEEHKSDNEVVVLADESLLIPVLNSIPNCYDDILVTMGYPYSKTITHQFLMQLFSFQKHINVKDEKIDFWALKRLLETELSMIVFSPQELSSIDVLLNEYVYSLENNELEKYFGGNLLKFINIIKDKWTPASCIESIKNTLFFINDALTKDFGFIKKQIDIAERICNKIDRLSTKYDGLIQITDIELIYSQSANEMSIKLEKNDDEESESSKGNRRELQIMGLLETRNLDFDVIHILSVNEGVLPQSKNSNSLIPYDIRLHYKLPIYKNKQAIYAYHFYRLFQSASTINIYYNTLAGGTGESEPSRFIRQIIHEMPTKSQNIDIVNTVYKNPDIKVNGTTTLEIKKTDEIIDKIKKRFYGEKEDGSKKGLSPTAISTYFKCPVQFYLKNIEYVNDDTREELIQSNEIGNIIHTFFEFLYQEFDKNKPINREDYENIIKNKKDEVYNRALAENNFPNGLPDKGFNYLSKRLIDKLINNFIEKEKIFLKDKRLKVIGLENNLYHEITTDNGDKIYLTGFADRIDMVIDNNKETIRILDYKTGSVKDEDVKIPDKKSISEIPEKSLQLLIYKYLYIKMNNDVNRVKANNIEPAIFGLLRIDNVYFPLVNYNDDFKSDTEDDDKSFVSECDKIFKELIEEILNKDIAFKQTTKTDNCKYCDFKHICKRYTKSYF